MVFNDKEVDFYLCKPDVEHTKLCVINGIDDSSCSLSISPLLNISTLTFDVMRYIDVNGEMELSNAYDNLLFGMQIEIPNVGIFVMEEPTIINDGYYEYKSISAFSLEHELENRDLVNFVINNGTEISKEYLATNNIDVNGFAKEYVTFYNINNTELSLLHLILDETEWTIGYVSNSLKNKKFSFEVDSESVYSFLTKRLSSTAKCVFYFNSIDRVINVYDINELGVDSNLTISFRNLLKTVNVEVDENSIYTRFNISGGNDLNIAPVNFGETKYANIDYFLKEPYFSNETVLKYNSWKNYREDRRDEYINIIKHCYDLQEEIINLETKLPSDSVEMDWNGFTNEELEDFIEYYEGLLTAMQISVDNNPQYDENNTYVTWKNINNETDHESYLTALYDTNYGYFTYYEILNYIIPNINIQLQMNNNPNDDSLEYDKSFETDWELYGTYELSSKIESYQEQLNTCVNHLCFADLNNDNTDELLTYSQITTILNYKNSLVFSNGIPVTYDNATNVRIQRALYEQYYRDYLLVTSALEGKHFSQSNYTVYYNRYTEIQNNLNNATNEYNKKTGQIELLNDEYDIANNTRLGIISDVAMDNPRFGLTSTEISNIKLLYLDTDYSNENITTTETQTESEKVDTAYELFQDAITQLYIESQPQYKFTTTLDNLLSIPEFKDYINNFDVANFIHLCIRDDYQVVIRITEIKYNPKDLSSEISVSYSTMQNTLNGRNDLASLFDSSLSSSKNSIKVGSTGNSTTDISITTDFINAIIKSNYYKSKFGEQLGTTLPLNVTFEELNAEVARINDLIAGRITSGYTDTINLNTANCTIEDALITNLVTSIIQGGTALFNEIITNDVLIHSKDGRFRISDNTLLVNDSNGNPRIQIGQEEGADVYSIIVYDNNGVGMKLNSEGLSESFIQDGSIKNDMLQDSGNGYSGISAGKLNLNSIISVINGNDENSGDTMFSASKIYFDETNQTLSQAYSTIAETVDFMGLYVSISSSNGTILKRDDDTTTLTAKVFKNGSEVNNSNYIYRWRRYLNNVLDMSFGGSVDYQSTSSITITGLSLANASYVYRITVLDSANGNNMIGQSEVTVSRITDGTVSASINIVPSSQVFVSTENNTYTPDTITLTPIIQSVQLNNLKWSYCVQGSTTWTELTNTTTSSTLPYYNNSTKVLTIPKDVNVLSSSINSVSFKCYDNTQSWISDTITITRLKNGKDGQGINIYDSFDTTLELYNAHPTGNVGDGYLVNGDLYVWSNSTSTWKNVGRIKGDKGDSTYVHIKYSNDGLTFTSNDGEVVGDYMGVLVDSNASDSTTFSDYSWKKIVGNDSYSILLTNECATFLGTTNGGSIDSAETSVIVLNGNEQINVRIDSIGDTNVNGTNTLSTGYTGLTAKVINNNTLSPTIQFNTTNSLRDLSGSIPIVMTANNKTFTKYFSFSVALQGIQGEDAKVIRISGSSQVFISEDGETYSPETIALTPSTNNILLSDLEWHYSNDGGVSWNKIYNTSLSTIECYYNNNSKVLTIPKNALIFNSTSSLSFRCRSMEYNEVHDIITIIKVKNGKDGLSINILGSYNTLNELIAEHPNGNQNDSYVVNSHLYIWVEQTSSWVDMGQFKGNDGVSSYMHIKYSNDGISFTANNGDTVGNYVGMFVSTSSTPSNSFNDYTWKKYVGTDGEDSYSAILSNESDMFSGGINYANAESKSTNINVYKGSTKIATTITKIGTVTVSGNNSNVATGYTGLTANISNNATTEPTITFNSTNLLTTPSGSVKITFTADGKTFTKYFSFAIAFVGASGNNGITAFLSNDSHTVPTDVNGANGVYTGATTTMYIYDAGTDISSQWTYSISTTSISGTSSNNNRTFTVNGMTADVGYVDITASKSGYTSITKRFTLTRAKQGLQGDGGQILHSYWIEPSARIIIRNVDTKNCTPQTITFNGCTATPQINKTSYSGIFKIYVSTNEIIDGDINYNLYYTSSNAESSTNYAPSNNVTSIKCELYNPNDLTNPLDTQEVFILYSTVSIVSKTTSMRTDINNNSSSISELQSKVNFTNNNGVLVGMESFYNSFLSLAESVQREMIATRTILNGDSTYNLFLDSNFSFYPLEWETTGNNLRSFSIHPTEKFKRTSSSPENRVIYVSGGNAIAEKFVYNVAPSTTYYFKVYYKVTSGNVNIKLTNYKTSTVDGSMISESTTTSITGTNSSWTLLERTITTSSTTSAIQVQFNYTGSGSCYISCPKLSSFNSIYDESTDIVGMEISSVASKAMQTANGFEWLVNSGNNVNSLSITDDGITAIVNKINSEANQIKINADKVDINGLVTYSNINSVLDYADKNIVIHSKIPTLVSYTTNSNNVPYSYFYLSENMKANETYIITLQCSNSNGAYYTPANGIRFNFNYTTSTTNTPTLSFSNTVIKDGYEDGLYQICVTPTVECTGYFYITTGISSGINMIVDWIKIEKGNISSLNWYASQYDIDEQDGVNRFCVNDVFSSDVWSHESSYDTLIINCNNSSYISSYNYYPINVCCNDIIWDISTDYEFYTISGYIKINDAISPTCPILNSNGDIGSIIQTGNTSLYSNYDSATGYYVEIIKHNPVSYSTIRLSTTHYEVQCYVDTNNHNGTKVSFEKFKIERGVMPTAWNYSPSDVAGSDIYLYGTTIIDGGKIDTDSLFARNINFTGTIIGGSSGNGGIIKSYNSEYTKLVESRYNQSADVTYNAIHYNTRKGMIVDLVNGCFSSPYFSIDSDGKTTFGGQINFDYYEHLLDSTYYPNGIWEPESKFISWGALESPDNGVTINRFDGAYISVFQSFPYNMLEGRSSNTSDGMNLTTTIASGELLLSAGINYYQPSSGDDMIGRGNLVLHEDSARFYRTPSEKETNTGHVYNNYMTVSTDGDFIANRYVETTQGIRSHGESRFDTSYAGGSNYSDPLPNVVCAIKTTGNIASTGKVYSNGVPCVTSLGIIQINNDANANLKLIFDNGLVGSIHYGDVSSDIKLKKNIKDTSVSATDTLNKIELKSFDWKNRDEHVDVGFIANQLETVIPRVVYEVEQQDGSTIKNINHFGLIPYLVKAIQEQNEEITKLRNDLNKLRKDS